MVYSMYTQYTIIWTFYQIWDCIVLVNAIPCNMVRQYQPYGLKWDLGYGLSLLVLITIVLFTVLTLFTWAFLTK